MPLHNWFIAISLLGIIFVIVPSFPTVRKILAAPLIVSDPDARGDAAYLLAGGNAFRERLAAAVDLYHMGRVPKIIFLNDPRRSSYNFTAQRNFTPTEWAIDFLKWRGLPEASIHLLKAREDGTFGTLTEAKLVAETLPAGLKKLVLVTSPAHTRRTRLAFRRTLPAGVELMLYPANSFTNSLEMYRPLWQEYLKLLFYSMIA